MVYGLDTNICDKFIYDDKLKMLINTLVKKKKTYLLIQWNALSSRKLAPETQWHLVANLSAL